ncbi:M48 family metallopeptidase [Reichenbachiella ulvae]|uniref:M48 family metallopeptidase n=1 Tax=Reichenbachiella ulvae TaxID=2980104 RepID=A0ABT3CQE7_9BACT|nr:M48 family metallopeptidase [Reichenbachiella ulvae]MCV9385744.1 M48 family metallopeptidase [Reichenbachiella ulvae]
MIAKIWKELLVLVALFAGLWLAFSYYNYDVNRNPFEVSAKTEREMAEFMNDYMLQDFEFIHNKAADSTLQVILERLTQNMDTVSYDYQLHIIKESQINAFTSLNGNIYIFSGLIEDLQSAEELALVLAHEIGHAEEKHVIEKIAKTLGMEAFFSIATGGDPVLISELAKLSMSTAFDRRNEEEADDYALDLAEKSQINPRRLGQFFIRMKAKKSSIMDDLSFFSTHPLDSDRIKKASDYKISDDFEEQPIPIDWERFQNLISS